MNNYKCEICNDKHFVIIPLYSALNHKCTFISIMECSCKLSTIALSNASINNITWKFVNIPEKTQEIIETIGTFNPGPTYFVGTDFNKEITDETT